MVLRFSWSSAVLGLVIALAACSSEEAAPSPEASFCGALSAAYAECGGGDSGSCGDTMSAECTNLAAVLSPSLLTAATACLEASPCEGGDPLACIGTSLGKIEPTEAQARFATSFCDGCSVAPGAACETAFFGTGSSPGLGVGLLPFGDEPLSRVEEACTSNKLGKTACQTAFSTCLTATATKYLVESVSTDVVACVFRGVEEGVSRAKTGGDGTSGGGGGGGDGCVGCAGCCQDGQCLAGTDADACGRGGAACEACQGDAMCASGRCSVGCGPGSCNGCCDEVGRCLTGAVVDACGSGGAACDVCSGDAACSEGQCKAPVVGGGGGGGVTPPSTWDVILVSAEIPEKKANGKSWDAFNGLPDPFARAKSGTKSGSAPTKNNTLTPVWNAKVLDAVTRASLEAEFQIQVFDDDNVFNDRVGTCRLSLTNASFDGTLKKAVCPPLEKDDVSFSIAYRIRPH
jgi:hypothetical protein